MENEGEKTTGVQYQNNDVCVCVCAALTCMQPHKHEPPYRKEKLHVIQTQVQHTALPSVAENYSMTVI